MRYRCPSCYEVTEQSTPNPVCASTGCNGARLIPDPNGLTDGEIFTLGAWLAMAEGTK